MKIEIKIPSISDLCPYCLGLGKQRVMQSAIAYGGKSIRANDKMVKCKNCQGTGVKANG